MENDPKNGASLVVFQDGRGKEQALPRLSPSKFIELANRVQRQRKEEFRANLKDAGILGTEKALGMLNDFDSRPANRGDVLQWSLLDEGMQQVILASMRQVNPKATEQDVDALALTPTDMLTVSSKLLHLNMDAPPAAGGGGGGATTKAKATGDNPLPGTGAGSRKNSGRKSRAS